MHLFHHWFKNCGSNRKSDTNILSYSYSYRFGDGGCRGGSIIQPRREPHYLSHRRNHRHSLQLHDKRNRYRDRHYYLRYAGLRHGRYALQLDGFNRQYVFMPILKQWYEDCDVFRGSRRTQCHRNKKCDS